MASGHVFRFLWVSVFASLLLWILLSSSTAGVGMVAPQPDAVLYCQSARQIAHGHPFMFSPLGEVSTGNTTYFYPFLLAPYYLFGGSGAGVFAYGHILNSLLYFAFIASWLAIFKKLIQNDKSRILASILLVFSGQAFSVALGQTDTALFMAVSSGLFASLLWRRMGLFGFFLVLSPWCRPEGTILSFLYLVSLFVLVRVHYRSVSRKEWAIAGMACVSALSVFGLNFLLTGQFQYQSVSLKGFFTEMPFAAACVNTTSECLRMFRSLFLGLSDVGSFRCYYSVPLASGICAFAGCFLYPWSEDVENRWKILWWSVSGIGAMFLVASSGYSGTNLDRYVGWILPIVLLWLVQGIEWLQRWKYSYWVALSSFFVLFHAVVLLMGFFPLLLQCGMNNADTLVDMRELSSGAPGNISVGVDDVGYAFSHHERHPDADFVVHNLSGIYSPSFLEKNPISNLEKIKHTPSMQFDFWLFSSGKEVIYGDVDVSPLVGKQCVESFGGRQIREVDWTPLRNALSVSYDTNAWMVSDSLDIGFPAEERSHDYRVFIRTTGYAFFPFGNVLTNAADHIPLYEVGRPILGGDKMTVKSVPGNDLRILMRTVSSSTFRYRHCSGTIGRKNFTVTNPIRLRVFVDGMELGVREFPVEEDPSLAQNVTIDIPGSFIKSRRTRIELFGDHMALAYWFLTPKE